MNLGGTARAERARGTARRARDPESVRRGTHPSRYRPISGMVTSPPKARRRGREMPVCPATWHEDAGSPQSRSRRSHAASRVAPRSWRRRGCAISSSGVALQHVPAFARWVTPQVVAPSGNPQAQGQIPRAAGPRRRAASRRLLRGDSGIATCLAPHQAFPARRSVACTSSLTARNPRERAQTARVALGIAQPAADL